MTNVRKNICKEINEDNMYFSYDLSIRNRSHNSGNLTEFIVMFGAHVRLFNCKSELSVQTRDNYACGNEQTQTILRYGQKNYKFEDSIAFFITFLSQSKHIRKILLKQDILLLSKNFKMKKKNHFSRYCDSISY